MVQDSIAEKFSTNQVIVTGVDVWNSSDSLINAFITTTGVTFPIAKKGASVTNSYDVVANSMVVIDQDGVVRFVQELGTSTVSFAQMKGMVSGAASTVRGLLSSQVVSPELSARGMQISAAARPATISAMGRVIPSCAPSMSLVIGSSGRLVRRGVSTLSLQ